MMKTLKDIGFKKVRFEEYINSLKQEAIKLVNNLRTNETYSPILIDKFPDSMKGSCIKDKFEDGFTRLSMEYGMIIILMEFFNITTEDLI